MFQVALLQLVPAGSQYENLVKGVNFCRKAKALGADLAIFPEMWNTGYTLAADKQTLQADAITAQSEFLHTFAQLAKELNMAIGITYLEQFAPAPRNTITVMNRHGNPVLTYAKVHTCAFGDESVLTPGDDFYVADLDTESGIVKIGAMICYDREFPESARVLMLKGAEIILVPNACPMQINRLAQLRARAFENMVGIATANYAKGKPDCNGHSSAFDGVVYAPGCNGERDTCLLEAGEAEGVYLASFDMEFIRDYRRKEVHGNAYRRPAKYHLLVDETVAEPFVRKDQK